MKQILIIFIFVILNFSSLASTIKNEFEKIRNNKISKIEEVEFFKYLSKIGYLIKTNQFLTEIKQKLR